VALPQYARVAYVRLAAGRNHPVRVRVLEHVQHVAGRLHDLMRAWCNRIARDAGRKTTGERRDEFLRDRLSELERPGLIRDLVVRRIDDQAWPRLHVQAVGAMLLDVLRGERAIPVALHVGLTGRRT